MWIKSGRCDSNGCVEVMDQEDAVLVRNSQDPDGPVVEFTAEEWGEFIAGDWRNLRFPE